MESAALIGDRRNLSSAVLPVTILPGIPGSPWRYRLKISLLANVFK
jgi:hypothetical protein